MQANEADSDYGLFNLFDFPISYISNMKFHVKLYPIIMKHNGKKKSAAVPNTLNFGVD